MACIALGVEIPALVTVDSSEGKAIDAAASGDRAAFDRLVASYGADLRRFVVRRVGKEHAEDVLQETWIAAWSSIGNFDRSSKFRTWLFGISLNKVKDFYRKSAQSANQARMHDNLTSQGGDPFSRAELRETIMAAVGELSQPQREVLELYYFLDMTLPDIANILDRNLNTVKYQFYRAHAEVSARLTPEVAL